MLNKKIRIILVFVLFIGAMFLSACQQEVGGRIRDVNDIKNPTIPKVEVDIKGGCGCYDGTTCTGTKSTSGGITVYNCLCCGESAEKK